MLHIVLFEPEIPQNVGNIARTCVGFNATLHLIKPYGFIFDRNHGELKRSGVNYWDKLKICEHTTYEDFLKTVKKNSSFYFLTRYGTKTTDQIKFNYKGDSYILFGKESTGIDKEILKANKPHTYRIPSSINVRSLNVSNCVAILAYLYVSKNKFSKLEKKEPFKKDIL